MSEAKTPKKEISKNLRWQRDRDREMVKGMFIFHEVPGGAMSFVYKAYREDPVERYDMVDGQVYTVPLGVARHLNKNGWYPEYEYVKGDTSTIAGYGPNSTMKIGKEVRRFSFRSLEFMDIDDLVPQEKNLVTVERV